MNDSSRNNKCLSYTSMFVIYFSHNVLHLLRIYYGIETFILKLTQLKKNIIDHSHWSNTYSILILILFSWLEESRFFFSLSVSLFVFCIFFGYLLLKPSAKRTILLTTPTSPLFNLKRNKLKEKCKDPEVISDNPRKDKVNPIYWWLVQPQEQRWKQDFRNFQAPDL